MNGTKGVAGLTPRLHAAADEIARLGRQDVVYDVGTDHAHLPIYLIKSGICETVTATDVSARSLERAKRNAEAAGVAGGISFYEGDGFSPIPDYKPGKIAVIAGIGGKNLTEIIDGGGNLPRAASMLILQPMSGQEILREWLFRNAYEMAFERLAREGRRVYSLFFCRGASSPQPYSYADLYLGKNVKYESDDEYTHFLRFTRLKIMNIYNGLAAERRERSEEAGRLAAVVREIDKLCPEERNGHTC